MTATVMRPRRVGEILDAGIKVYVRNAWTLMGLAAIVVIPMQAVAAIVLLSTVSSGSDIPTGVSALSTSTPAANPTAALGAEAVLFVVELIVSLLTTAACVKAVSDIYLEQPTGFGVSLRFAVRRLPALLVMQILLLFGVMLGFLALVIPGIWLIVRWAVASPALLSERIGPARALGRSGRLVRGRWWPTAGVLMVATILVTVVSGVFQALLVGVASLPRAPTVLLEAAAVRRFLERRETLERIARRELALRLAGGLRPKVAGAPPLLDAERFLEQLAFAKDSRR